MLLLECRGLQSPYAIACNRVAPAHLRASLRPTAAVCPTTARRAPRRKKLEHSAPRPLRGARKGEYEKEPGAAVPCASTDQPFGTSISCMLPFQIMGQGSDFTVVIKAPHSLRLVESPAMTTMRLHVPDLMYSATPATSKVRGDDSAPRARPRVRQGLGRRQGRPQAGRRGAPPSPRQRTAGSRRSAKTNAPQPSKPMKTPSGERCARTCWRPRAA